MQSHFINKILPVIIGLTAANLYYIQPLIPEAAHLKGVSYNLVSMIYTMSLAGNVVALVFLAPLGDFVNRKKLISGLYLALSLTLLSFYSLKNIYSLIAIAFIMGFELCVIPITIAYISTNKTSGINSIGKIMSGLLLGILLSRFVSSSFATICGWNSVYVFAAFCMLFSFGVINRYFPEDDNEKAQTDRYLNVIFGTLSLLKTNSSIRMYAGNGFIIMAIFSIFWNNIAIYLHTYLKLDQFSIGLFSLTGFAGASAAMLSNKLLRFFKHSSTFLFACLFSSFLLMAFISKYLIVLALVTLVMDGLIQLTHVNNQVNMYKTCSGNESRAASCYMTSFMAGGVVGSKLSTYIYSGHGWFGLSMLCAGFCLLGLAYHLSIFNSDQCINDG